MEIRENGDAGEKKKIIQDPPSILLSLWDPEKRLGLFLDVAAWCIPPTCDRICLHQQARLAYFSKV